VAAVARAPDEHVGTTLAVHVIRSSAADEQIVALAAVQIIRSAKTEDEVVAVAAIDEISTRAAGEEVVSGSAQDGGVGRCRQVDDIIARAGVHGLLRAGDR